MKISFYVPAYQYGRYLDECVRAILSQSHGDLEVLIMDDASTDETPDIARALEREDSRVRYVRNDPNIGHLANYNKAIALATGQAVWGISADDRLAHPGAVADFVQAMAAQPEVAFCFGRVQVMDEHGVPVDKCIPRRDYPLLAAETPTVFTGRGFFRRLLSENFVPAATVMVRKAALSKAGLDAAAPYHPRLFHSADWYLWLQLSLVGDVYYQPAVTGYYRVHGANMHRTYEKPRAAVDNNLLCYRELLAWLRVQGAPRGVALRARLAMMRFKRKHGVPLTLPETLLHATVRPFVSLAP